MATAAQLGLPEVSTEATRERVRRRPSVITRALPRPMRVERLPRPSDDVVRAVRDVLEAREELGEDVHGGLLLGDVLVQLRTRLGLSQDQIMARSGLARRRMRAIEAGEAAGAEELAALGRALDVPPVGLATLAPGRTIEATRIVAERTGPLALPGFPGALSWETTPWSLDAAARAFVDEHPGGATVEEIAEAIGVSTRWVERCLAMACAVVREALEDEDG
jgi:transcriptional regulator with XRE-family HTH domain